MDGRLGNGMALWLGGALLAHAALLALPGARPPAGGSVVSSSLDVRLLKATTGSDPVAAPEVTGAAPVSEPAAEETTPAPMPRLETVPRAEMGSDPIFYPRATEQKTAAEAEMGSDPISAARSTDAVTTMPERGAEALAARSEPAEPAKERPADTFPHASIALAEPPPLPAAARPASVATATPDHPALTPAGTPDEHDRQRLLELTDRLHRAIERQKRYPLSARRLGREGTASVAFRLRPDGAIDDLEVTATSGEPALDRAALRAVSGISPFGEARAYLDRSAPFRIDIAFRLR